MRIGLLFLLRNVVKLEFYLVDYSLPVFAPMQSPIISPGGDLREMHDLSSYYTAADAIASRIT
jgi:hypothetical protein